MGLVESGILEPEPPELKDRLSALRLQKAELDRDLTRLLLEAVTSRGPSRSSPEVLPFIREWRAGVDKRENWMTVLDLAPPSISRR
jgi:hypothetical protein